MCPDPAETSPPGVPRLPRLGAIVFKPFAGLSLTYRSAINTRYSEHLGWYTGPRLEPALQGI